MFEVAVACLVLTALLAWLNLRFVGLPISIGVMGIAILLSFVLLGLDNIGVSGLHDQVRALLTSIDLSELVIQGLLSVLLFAGALHFDLSELEAYKWQVGLLAVVGTIVTATLVGFGLWMIVRYSGVDLPLAYCLIFGALISPTDPIAVMSVLRSAGAPRNLELVIAGESLFNDAVGIVLFLLGVSMLATGEPPTFAAGALLLLQGGGGGIVLGFALGYTAFWMIKTIDSYQEEILITLATVLGGYTLASHLHVSGPLAMVVAGLIIGNHGREHAMNAKTARHLDSFWGLLDSMLNAVLFMLLGLEFVVIAFPPALILPAAVAIFVCLAARLVAVAVPMVLMGKAVELPRGAWKVLTWAGLRGGVSVALALSLPAGPHRETVLALTWSVVVFSIMVQGLTLRRLVRAQGWKRARD